MVPNRRHDFDNQLWRLFWLFINDDAGLEEEL